MKWKHVKGTEYLFEYWYKGRIDEENGGNFMIAVIYKVEDDVYQTYINIPGSRPLKQRAGTFHTLVIAKRSMNEIIKGMKMACKALRKG